MSLRGSLLKLLYRLRRHLWGGWPLSRWLGLLLLGCLLLAFLHYWPVFWPAVLLGGVYGLYLLLLVWAARSRYVRFQPVSPPPPKQPPRPLRREELIRLRASGWFTVEGRGRYYADLEADFETVGTREHIILGRVTPSRFLGVGRWPADEWGWWYIFFQPAMICRLEVGRFCHGSQPRWAIHVVYAPDQEAEESIYLVFDELLPLWRVWADLLADAPQEVRARALDSVRM